MTTRRDGCSSRSYVTAIVRQSIAIGLTALLLIARDCFTGSTVYDRSTDRLYVRHGDDDLVVSGFRTTFFHTLARHCTSYGSGSIRASASRNAHRA